ncbi:MAG: metallophosphoesterase [Bacteroidia bacterium]|nr:metallophosphoesterase [Bacteroidia bacterium]
MKISRRAFIKNVSLAGSFLITGGFTSLSADEIFELRKKVRLRFVVASDGHYGQPETLFDQFHDTLIEKINMFHKIQPVNFCVINGDVIHNEKSLLVEVKNKLDFLHAPYYVTKGNHDMVSDAYWNEVWKMPVNHNVVVKNNAIIMATTSNEQGDYLSPDLQWLKDKLDDSKKFKNTFIFIHIPQAKWTANAIDTPAFFELLKKYTNIRAVFNGHEHDQDGVRMNNGIPYLFDSHIGGNWGTEYKGFRVVEVMKDNAVITYMMNPEQKLREERL